MQSLHLYVTYKKLLKFINLNLMKYNYKFNENLICYFLLDCNLLMLITRRLDCKNLSVIQSRLETLFLILY